MEDATLRAACCFSASQEFEFCQCVVDTCQETEVSSRLTSLLNVEGRHDGLFSERYRNGKLGRVPQIRAERSAELASIANDPGIELAAHRCLCPGEQTESAVAGNTTKVFIQREQRRS